MVFHSRERSKIQELYEACSVVFSGNGRGLSPTIDDIRWLQELLGSVEAVDVGIDGSDGDGEGEEVPEPTGRCERERRLISGSKVAEITYIHIYECDEFSMGVFCFPAGARMPLHDHPEMAVLSKVLYGSVSVKAYDWAKQHPPNPRYKKCGLASLAIDNQILQPTSPATVLFPSSGGNIHSFTALTPCAILDVLSPPYSDREGRPSTYFSEISIPSLPGFVILEERDVPKDLIVVGAPYQGPELVIMEDDLEDDGWYYN